MQIEIGVAFETPYGFVEYVQQDLSEIVPEPVSIKRLPDLAGPNNVLQILGDAEFWKLLAVALISIYGKGFVEEAGKDSWKGIAKNAKPITDKFTSPIRRLLNSILGYSKPPLSGIATLAVPIGRYTRNAGIDVRGCSEAELASLIILMSRHAAAIQAHIEACLSSEEIVTVSFESNPDMSIKLVPNDDGSVSLSWSQWDNFQSPKVEKKTIKFE